MLNCMAPSISTGRRWPCPGFASLSMQARQTNHLVASRRQRLIHGPRSWLLSMLHRVPLELQSHPHLWHPFVVPDKVHKAFGVIQQSDLGGPLRHCARAQPPVPWLLVGTAHRQLPHCSVTPQQHPFFAGNAVDKPLVSHPHCAAPPLCGRHARCGRPPGTARPIHGTIAEGADSSHGAPPTQYPPPWLLRAPAQSLANANTIHPNKLNLLSPPPSAPMTHRHGTRANVYTARALLVAAAGFLSHPRFPARLVCIAPSTATLSLQSPAKLAEYCERSQCSKGRPWQGSDTEEIGRLSLGYGAIKGTIAVPACRCRHCHEKTSLRRVPWTAAGGDKVDYPFDVSTETSNLLSTKLLFNSVLTTPNEKLRPPI
jgi:hypothetical protein